MRSCDVLSHIQDDPACKYWVDDAFSAVVTIRRLPNNTSGFGHSQDEEALQIGLMEVPSLNFERNDIRFHKRRTEMTPMITTLAKAKTRRNVISCDIGEILQLTNQKERDSTGDLDILSSI